MNGRYLWLFLGWIGCGAAWGQGYIPTPGVPLLPTSTPQPNDCALLGKIYRAADTGDLKTLSAIAAKHKKNPGLRATCRLFLYLGKKVGPEEFIRSFPAQEKEFWAFADGFAPCEDIPTPKALEEGRAPVFEYYRQLIALMGKGNERAAEKVLATFEFADGEIAEGVFPEIGEFCLENPDRVLENWRLFQPHLKGLSRCLEYASRDELEGARNKVAGFRGNAEAKAQFLELIDGALNDN